jgi:hypothetical protein
MGNINKCLVDKNEIDSSYDYNNIANIQKILYNMQINMNKQKQNNEIIQYFLDLYDKNKQDIYDDDDINIEYIKKIIYLHKDILNQIITPININDDNNKYINDFTRFIDYYCCKDDPSKNFSYIYYTLAPSIIWSIINSMDSYIEQISNNIYQINQLTNNMDTNNEYLFIQLYSLYKQLSYLIIKIIQLNKQWLNINNVLYAVYAYYKRGNKTERRYYDFVFQNIDLMNLIMPKLQKQSEKDNDQGKLNNNLLDSINVKLNEYCNILGQFFKDKRIQKLSNQDFKIDSTIIKNIKLLTVDLNNLLKVFYYISDFDNNTSSKNVFKLIKNLMKLLPDQNKLLDQELLYVRYDYLTDENLYIQDQISKQLYLISQLIFLVIFDDKNIQNYEYMLSTNTQIRNNADNANIDINYINYNYIINDNYIKLIDLLKIIDTQYKSYISNNKIFKNNILSDDERIEIKQITNKLIK